MPSDDSVAMYIPKEYFAQLSEAIRVGLVEAKIPREARKALTGWWNAESTYVQEFLDEEKQADASKS